MKAVISIGGSVLVPDGINKEYMEKLSEMIKNLIDDNKIAIVTGGGKTARKYINLAREAGASEILCDLIGIEATRLNARLLSAVLGEKANLEPPKDFMGALKAMDFGKVVVMGGTHPGHSTDAVAALLAEYIDADIFINATNVDGIYDKDPQKHPEAKKLDKISSEELIEMVKSYSLGAGKYELMDILAAKVIQRSKTKTVFLDGRNLESMKKAIEGKDCKGTIVE